MKLCAMWLSFHAKILSFVFVVVFFADFVQEESVLTEVFTAACQKGAMDRRGTLQGATSVCPWPSEGFMFSYISDTQMKLNGVIEDWPPY